jgi:hypothetical protein
MTNIRRLILSGLMPLALAPALLAPAAAAQETEACPFLPAEQSPAIEVPLPASTLMLYDPTTFQLPIKFQGVHPFVIRKTVPFGSIPKVTIERYSSTPTVTYDESEGMVMVSSEACSATQDESEKESETDSEAGSQTVSGATSWSKFSWMAPMALAGSAFFGNDATVLGVASMAVVASALPGANAADVICLPSVKIVVEAPAAHMDAVEACWKTINDTTICPQPFPTFDTCEDVAPTCSVVVVGAAAGGLYSALR